MREGNAEQPKPIVDDAKSKKGLAGAMRNFKKIVSVSNITDMFILILFRSLFACVRLSFFTLGLMCCK